MDATFEQNEKRESEDPAKSMSGDQKMDDPSYLINVYSQDLIFIMWVGFLGFLKHTLNN